jgi:hypothetical protein
MHHKRHKPGTKTDSDVMGSWSPGTLSLKKALSPLPDEAKPTPSKKPKGYCIKLKGPHLYASGRLKVLSWLPTGSFTGWVEQRCSGCGKKEDWLI